LAARKFLNEVVERADCGILVDVNNIYVRTSLLTTEKSGTVGSFSTLG